MTNIEIKDPNGNIICSVESVTQKTNYIGKYIVEFDSDDDNVWLEKNKSKILSVIETDFIKWVKDDLIEMLDSSEDKDDIALVKKYIDAIKRKDVKQIIHGFKQCSKKIADFYLEIDDPIFNEEPKVAWLTSNNFLPELYDNSGQVSIALDMNTCKFIECLVYD